VFYVSLPLLLPWQFKDSTEVDSADFPREKISAIILLIYLMDLPLPRELWSVIGKHLSVLDKCALISTCQAIQAQLYNDPFWLDFTLTNLLRGLTMEEVIILTFSKANPDRLSHSRISQFKNFLTKNIGDNACKYFKFYQNNLSQK
jgi:hypothetical protein